MRQNVGTKFQGLVFMEQILPPLVTFVGLDLLGPPGPICTPIHPSLPPPLTMQDMHISLGGIQQTGD